MYEPPEELGQIPNEKFIGAFKYDANLKWKGKRAGYIIAKLKDSELLAVKLKFDLGIES